MDVHAPCKIKFCFSTYDTLCPSAVAILLFLTSSNKVGVHGTRYFCCTAASDRLSGFVLLSGVRSSPVGYGCRGRRACPHVLFSFIAEVPEVSFHRAGLEGKDLLYKKRCGGGWL